MGSTINPNYIAFVLLLICTSCGVYSLSGASIDARLKTYTVSQFSNNAPLVLPSLGQQFTEKLRDKMNSQTSLKNSQTNADVQFEGTITNYSVSPASIGTGSTTQLNRLTVSVRVKFVNRVDDKKNFEETFTQYQDFGNLPLSQVQDELNRQIGQRLIDAIFNRAFVNW